MNAVRRFVEVFYYPVALDCQITDIAKFVCLNGE
jgi:hypothetical protein